MKKVAKLASPFTQVAALPVRTAADGATDVLMVTSRDTGRWLIPKGWPMPGKTDWEAAAIEAMEEAGVIGAVDSAPLGTYTYFKRQARRSDLIEVSVYRLSVSKQLSDWPEREQRRVRWFRSSSAAELVQEPGLSAILRSLGSVIAPASAASFSDSPRESAHKLWRYMQRIEANRYRAEELDLLAKAPAYYPECRELFAELAAQRRDLAATLFRLSGESRSWLP